MIAVLLIGGKGTRLRPVTCALPKPLVPVANRPFLTYQLEILRRHGIRDAVLCTGYRRTDFTRLLGRRAEGINLHFVHETQPLGTGGAVKNAEKFLTETALVLNGDVLNALDITKFVRSHRRSRAVASIALTRVKDPTVFGLVETEEDGRVRRFIEKPSWDEITCNTVNAGAYLFEPSIIRGIPANAPHSLERELFPRLLTEKKRLQGFITGGYWTDIGTVDRYLEINLDVLHGRTPFAVPKAAKRGRFRIAAGARVPRDTTHEGEGTVLLGKGAVIGPYVKFIGSVALGKGCVVGKGAVLENCVVLDGSRIGDGAQLKRCVIGRGCRLGHHTIISPGRAVGDRSVFSPFSQL